MDRFLVLGIFRIFEEIEFGKKKKKKERFETALKFWPSLFTLGLPHVVFSPTIFLHLMIHC